VESLRIRYRFNRWCLDRLLKNHYDEVFDTASKENQFKTRHVLSFETYNAASRGHKLGTFATKPFYDLKDEKRLRIKLE
jgi:hypothetical protein